MRLYPFVAFFVLLFAACSPGALPTPQVPSTPAVTPLEGSVSIDYPKAGSIIYSEVLYLSGTAKAIPGRQFKLKLVGADDRTLAQAAVQVQPDGTWQLEIVHGYSGEPLEVTVFALPDYAGAPPGSDYTVTPIVMAGSRYRPEGAFGSITAPLEGDSLGGDLLEVSGTASGVFENQFRVELKAADGRVISGQTVTLFNPYFADEVPWVTEIATNGYTGAAEIRAFAISPKDGSEIVLGSVEVTITQEAGRGFQSRGVLWG